MKIAARERIGPLLEVLRANAALREVRPAMFQLDGRDFLHFHDEGDQIIADCRLTKSFVRLPVGTAAEQAELLERIDAVLDALDKRTRERGWRVTRHR